jgi:protein SCO1/2
VDAGSRDGRCVLRELFEATARAFAVHAVALAFVLLAWVAPVAPVGATEMAHSMSMADEHAHHHHVIPETRRTTVNYQVPDVKLVRDDGKAVGLKDELDDGRPVVLAFIYTSCTTVCPLTSQTLSELQAKLGAARDRVHIVSVSIDPEQDTPTVLREYAKRYGAGPEWQHYTGTVEASRTAQIAFDVYRGNKMDHQPAILVRATPGAKWVRIDGFATADQLAAELPTLHASAR